MTNMHLFGDIRWREINHNLLLFCLWVTHVIHKFVHSLLNEIILEFYLKESFLVGRNWAEDIILKEILFNFLSKLNNRFGAEGVSFFLVAMDVELFHGWWRNVFTLAFRSILQQDVWLDSKSLVDNGSHSFPDKQTNKLSFCFHLD